MLICPNGGTTCSSPDYFERAGGVRTTRISLACQPAGACPCLDPPLDCNNEIYRYELWAATPTSATMIAYLPERCSANWPSGSHFVDGLHEMLAQNISFDEKR